MKHKGFTIVELLVVIAAIVILASITIVSYIFMRDDGHDTNIKATVKLVGDAIQLEEFQTNSRISGTGPLSAANGVDTLVGLSYLKSNYRSNLVSKNASSQDQIIRWYPCAGGGFVIYAALNNPSPEDKTNFDSTVSTCGHGSSQAPTTGANKYSYAQTF